MPSSGPVEARTHLNIDSDLCGTSVELKSDFAHVELRTIEAMAADAQGLVHGGFVFGAADYAAMLAVNDPNVVLAGATTRFLAPVVVGETVIARAEVTSAEGKKRQVRVVASVGPKKVFEGDFMCVVLPRHVLTQEG